MAPAKRRYSRRNRQYEIASVKDNSTTKDKVWVRVLKDFHQEHTYLSKQPEPSVSKYTLDQNYCTTVRPHILYQLAKDVTVTIQCYDQAVGNEEQLGESNQQLGESNQLLEQLEKEHTSDQQLSHTPEVDVPVIEIDLNRHYNHSTCSACEYRSECSWCDVCESLACNLCRYCRNALEVIETSTTSTINSVCSTCEYCLICGWCFWCKNCPLCVTSEMCLNCYDKTSQQCTRKCIYNHIYTCKHNPV